MHRIPLVLAVVLLAVLVALMVSGRDAGGEAEHDPAIPPRLPLVVHHSGFAEIDATIAWRDGAVRRWYINAAPKPKPPAVSNKRALRTGAVRKETASNLTSGPWAIPTYIVICESGGLNVENPRSTASGYYQIIDSTWAAHGGLAFGVSHASDATLAQQSIIAARIWASGGPGQWACA